MEKPRCLTLFEQSIRSEHTLKMYQYYLDQFLGWAKKDYQNLLLLSPNEIQILIEDYLIYLKKRLSPNSIYPRLAAIDKFFGINGIEYKKRGIKAMLPEKVKPAGNKSWSTAQISTLLEFTDTKRAKALIHFLAASGCRIGAIDGLRRKHVKELEDGCKSLQLYAGTKWEYTTFLHGEASKSLEEYWEERKKNGELIDDDSYVFRGKYILGKQESIPLSSKSAQAIVNRVVKRAKIDRNKSSTEKRFDIPILTGFRKRFNTILKSNSNISYAIAERLMDHRTNLERHYLDTSVELLFSEYKKAIPNLMISETHRLELKNLELENDKSNLEKQITHLVEQAADRVKNELRREGYFVDFDKNRKSKK